MSASSTSDTGQSSPSENPSDVSTPAGPQTRTSYGGSGSSRIFVNTDGRRPNT
ncbi:hypothetical protein [Nocardioides sp. TF02-7]|uniref:hypothetical protein n=1 Tax=Nocardioides sp. TF02-7 TaxID=2917724 RepID=UPI001F06626B|nr:hypothetical protein [Nocardioides sp. TF02-7]UMG94278.1 hypothetical protein MF408_09820 [Nocardioides sp. TF02-7]